MVFDKKFEEKLSVFFVKAFKEVVVPLIEKIDNHLDRHDQKFDNQERRISKLESQATTL